MKYGIIRGKRSSKHNEQRWSVEISTQSRQEEYEVTICTSAKRINLEKTAEGTNNRFTLLQHSYHEYRGEF